MNKIPSTVGLILSIVCFCSAISAEPVTDRLKTHVGVVILVSGDVTAIDLNNKTRFLKRRSKFYVGDIVHVAVQGRAQLRFLDGTLVSLDENTQIKIDDFSFSKENHAENKNFFTLIKGGLRTITGAIGKTYPDAHAVNTPVATIGVRGTQYSVHFDERLSVGVYKGDVTITNEMGSLDIGAHGNFDYALVYDESSAPVGSLIQPKILAPLAAENHARFNDVAKYKNKKLLEYEKISISHQSWLDSSNSDDLFLSLSKELGTFRDETMISDQNDYALDTGGPLYNSTTDFRLTDNERRALQRFALAVTGRDDKYTLLKDRILRMKSTDVIDPNIDHVMVDAAGDTNSGLPNYVLRASSAANATLTSLTSYDRQDVNGIAVDLHWGKWNIQYVNQYDSMDPASFEKINDTLHWITGTAADPLVVGSLAGTLSYTDLPVIQGVTHNGIITSLGVTVDVDFSNSSVSGNIDFSDSSGSWFILMNGSISGSKLDFNTVSATYSGGSMTDGQAQGMFVGPRAEFVAGAFTIDSANGSGDYADGVFSVGCNPNCL